jgi:hypothetical protein
MTTLYGTFPILLPGVTESISRYGLKKTSGTILFKPDQEAEARALAETYGQVFPDPQSRTTDMGLLEMSFDAYTNTGARNGVFGVQTLNLSKNYSTEIQLNGQTLTWAWTIYEIWFADSWTQQKVIASSASSAFLQTTSPILGKKLLTRKVVGIPQPGSPTQLQITWASDVTSVSRRNFGTFDEVDIVTSLQATIA